MAAQTTETLNILIRAKDQYSSEFAKMSEKFKVAGVAITASLAAIGGSILKITKQTADYGEQISKMNKLTGVSTEILSEFGHVARVMGIEVEQLGDAIKDMAIKAYEAVAEPGGARDAFQKLGVEVRDAGGNVRATEDIFLDTVKALQAVANDAERVALAEEVMAGAGEHMMQILSASTDEVEKLRKEAERLGLTFSELEAQEAAQLNQELKRMTATLEGMSSELGKTFIPVITDVSERFRKFFVWVNHVTKANEGQKDTFESLTKKIDDTNKKIQELTNSKQLYSRWNFIARADTDREIEKLKELIPLYNSQRAELKELEKTKEESATGVGGATTSRGRSQADIDTEIEAYTSYTERMMEIDQARNESIAELMLIEQQFRDENRARKDRELKEDAEREKKRKQLMIYGAQTTASALVSIGESLNTLSQGQHKEMFLFLKAARAGETIVNTYAAATRAYQDVPYPLNFAAAAAVTAAGLANLAVINSTQFGSSSAGGGGYTSPSVDTGNITDISPAPTTATPAQQTEITINITNPLGTENWDQIAEDEIIPAIKRANDRNVGV